MLTSDRMKAAFRAAVRAYVVSPDLEVRPDHEEQIARMCESAEGAVWHLTVATVSSFVDGGWGHQVTSAGVRAYVDHYWGTGSRLMSDLDMERLAARLEMHGGGVQRAAEAAAKAWKEWPAACELSPHVEILKTAKRLGVAHPGREVAEWDWFVGYSPRNSNNHAEGAWEHWIALAIDILRDDLTAHVRPDVHKTATDLLPAMDVYASAERYLTGDEIQARMVGAEDVIFFRD